MQLTPNELADILKSVSESKELIKLFAEVANEVVPTILESFAPTTDAMFESIASAYHQLYESLQSKGFSEEQSFILLLEYQNQLKQIKLDSNALRGSVIPKSDTDDIENY